MLYYCRFVFCCVAIISGIAAMEDFFLQHEDPNIGGHIHMAEYPNRAIELPAKPETKPPPLSVPTSKPPLTTNSNIRATVMNRLNIWMDRLNFAKKLNTTIDDEYTQCNTGLKMLQPYCALFDRLYDMCDRAMSRCVVLEWWHSDVYGARRYCGQYCTEKGKPICQPCDERQYLVKSSHTTPSTDRPHSQTTRASKRLPGMTSGVTKSSTRLARIISLERRRFKF